jgi:hypothetical protein
LENIEVEEFTDILYEKNWVYLVQLILVLELTIFADVDQSEVLGYPFHELNVLLLHCQKLRACGG